MYDFSNIPDDEYVMTADQADGDDDRVIDFNSECTMTEEMAVVDDLNTVILSAGQEFLECPLQCNGCGHWKLGGYTITCENCPVADSNYRLDYIQMRRGV